VTLPFFKGVSVYKKREEQAIRSTR